MTWFKVDDTFAFHPKAVAAGNAALGLWVRAGSWSSQQLREGFVPHHMIPTMGTISQAKALVKAGLWAEVDGGYQFHQWTERNPSRDQIERDREAAAQRQRRAREKAKASRTQHDPVMRESRRDTTVSHGPPDPTRIEESSNDDSFVTSHPDPTINELCQHLADRIEQNGSKRPTITPEWHHAAHHLLTTDQHPPDHIHQLIDWTQNDPFWRANILTMTHLRNRYDQLRLHSQRPTTPHKPTPTAPHIPPMRQVLAELEARIQADQEAS